MGESVGQRESEGARAKGSSQASERKRQIYEKAREIHREIVKENL